MGSFYPVTLGVDSMSAAELDRIAVERAGVVGGIALGYATRGHAEPREGYAFGWIATRGCGNEGLLVLRGLTPEKRELLRQGRTRRLMALGATYVQAQRMDNVRARFVREEAVTRAALATYQSPAWDAYPGVGGGVNRWRRRYADAFDGELEGLSAPRLDAVHALVEELRKLH
jgi:hypothetical protein